MLSARHEIFMEVAANLSFSKASEVLFISQPAISKHIKALEAFYKTVLFERKGNAIYLSKGGQLLLIRLKEAKKIQDLLEFELSVLKDHLKAKAERSCFHGLNSAHVLKLCDELLVGNGEEETGNE